MRIENLKKYRTFLIVLAYLIMLILGITVGITLEEVSNQKMFVCGFVLAFVFTHICILDRKIIGKPLPISTYWLVLILWIVAVPICIIQARGWAGFKIIVIHFVGLILTYFVSFLVTYLLVYGI